MNLANMFRKKDSKQIKKNLNKKLKKINSKELKQFINQETLHEDFLDILSKINYEKNSKKIRQLIAKAKKIALKIPEYSGWPSSSKFWDIEALAWKENIPLPVRKFIGKKIKKTIPKGKNLDIGSGSCSYVKNSAVIDYSEEMLKLNKSGKKILFNLNNGKLPLNNNSFDSATLVFLINYIKELKPLLKDVKRILKKKGKIIIVQSAKPTAGLYEIKQERFWKPEDVEKIMKSLKLKTNIYENAVKRTKLIFIEGAKQ